jgi:cell division protein FtsL
VTPADYIAAVTLAVLIVGGIIHLHVKLAEVRTDVRWIKQRIRELTPHYGWPEGS